MLNFLRGIGSFIADYRVEILAILCVTVFWSGLLWLAANPEVVDDSVTGDYPTGSNASDNSEPERKPKQVCRKKWFSLTDTWECWEE